MSKEKQIEEMANAINEMDEPNAHYYGEHLEMHEAFADCFTIAKHLYNAGYRKQSEGHWFILEYEYFTCSKCGYYHPNGCDSTKEAKEKLADGKVPKYCSECGAHMRKEDEGK